MADAMSKVTELVEPLVTDAGLELYDIVREGNILRITLEGTEGVGMDALRIITRAVSICFDDNDPIPGSYTMEITSPGLERRLRLPRHFEGAVGEIVSIKTMEPIGGDRRFNGRLVSATEQQVVVANDPDGDERDIPLDKISRAHTVFVWDSGADKKTPKNSQRKASSS